MWCENEADSSFCYRLRCSCDWEDRLLARGHWSCLQKMSSSCQHPGSLEEWGPRHGPCQWSGHGMSRISDDCTRCWPLAIPDVGLFAIYIASLHPSPRRPPTHRPRRCPARPRPPHQRRHQRCPEAHQRHCRTSPHYPPGVNKKWRVSSATLCLNDHRFWCCHLGEVMHPSKFENCGHAVEEAADDEPVQGRGIMNLNRRGCYRSLMTKT